MKHLKKLLIEEEELSDVDVEEGKMSDILDVPEDEDIADGYDGSPEDAAQELVDAVGESEAASMINYAANISGDEFLEDMQDAIKNIDEQFRGVVRSLIKQELSEMTTTSAAGGYQTPFAFGDKEDEKKEDDVEEFLDTYGWEMAELAEKMRKGELTEAEKEKVERYIQKVRSMRDGDVSGYDKKSNYLPHNLKEAVGQEPTVIRTPKFDLRVYNSENGNLKMEVIDSDGSRPVADITLGKRGGQKLMDAMTYHL